MFFYYSVTLEEVFLAKTVVLLPYEEVIVPSSFSLKVIVFPKKVIEIVFSSTIVKDSAYSSLYAIVLFVNTTDTLLS